jgi:hypothetical protein
MRREHIFFLVILLLGGGWLAFRGATGKQPGMAYEMRQPDGSTSELSRNAAAEMLKSPVASVRASVHISTWRSLGIWVAAFFTLAIFSFLYRDNPFYKFAEHAFVGISAAYWMVVGFWTTVIPNLVAKLFPYPMKFSLLPGVDLNDAIRRLATESVFRNWVNYESAVGRGFNASWWQLMDLAYWVPLVLGVMLLWRLVPTRSAKIARWPLAFVIGTTAGIRLTGFTESDFIAQIAATIIPFYDPVRNAAAAIDPGKTFIQSMNNVLIAIGVIAGLIYFFFSTEHKGMVGRTARVGIWVLMITFGAGFGMTVMGRIALLVGRLKFLTDDWLNIHV